MKDEINDLLKEKDLEKLKGEHKERLTEILSNVSEIGFQMLNVEDEDRREELKFDLSCEKARLEMLEAELKIDALDLLEEVLTVGARSEIKIVTGV